MNADHLRQTALEFARRHKASWIELGRCLYTIHRDKHYKAWGFLSFEAYCKKELSLKESTAAKLLKSYRFLEDEEPRMVSPAFSKECTPQRIPDYHSVNLLRLARENKKLTTEDFADLRQTVLAVAKEPKEVRAQVKKLVEERDDREPAEVRNAHRKAAIKRLVTVLSNARRELESEKLLPAYLLKQMHDLAQKLEDQLA